MSSSMMAEVRDTREVETQVALAGFLAGYSGYTRLAYQQDLRTFLGWIGAHRLVLLEVRRTHIELFARFRIRLPTPNIRAVMGG
jgi:hypothetical protein